MNVLVIGGGNMGSILAEGMLSANIITQQELFVFEKDEERASELRTKGMNQVYSEEGDFIELSDVIILAVKPQDALSIYPVIQPYVNDQKIIVSIMAGVKMSSIQEHTGGDKIVRAMPNLPCQLGKGVIGYVSTGLNEEEVSSIHQMLASTGAAISIDEEDKIDAITAISGSGPAYVFYFIDAMVQAAKQLGFNEEEASQMVVQTFEGSIALLKENELSCQDWMTKVASKGGTTEAALLAFDQYDIKNSIGKGVLRAEQRSKELSKG